MAVAGFGADGETTAKQYKSNPKKKGKNSPAGLPQCPAEL